MRAIVLSDLKQAGRSLIVAALTILLAMRSTPKRGLTCYLTNSGMLIIITDCIGLTKHCSSASGLSRPYEKMARIFGLRTAASCGRMARFKNRGMQESGCITHLRITTTLYTDRKSFRQTTLDPGRK